MAGSGIALTRQLNLGLGGHSLFNQRLCGVKHGFVALASGGKFQGACIGIGQNQINQGAGHGNDFMDSLTTPKTTMAMLTTDCMPTAIGAHGLAMRAQQANQSLGTDQAHARSQVVRWHPHVPQSQDGACGSVGVQGGEHQVSRLRGLSSHHGG